ncbi:cell division protein FtsH, partial [Deinococcus sp. SDU3-2]|nr:cell division protein FtsH [Deinococcus terrestris]
MKRGAWGWGLAAAVGALLLLIIVLSPRGRPDELGLDDLAASLRAGKVATLTVQIQNNTALLTGRLDDGEAFQTRTLAADPLIALPRLEAAGVEVTYAAPPRLSVITLVSGLLTGLLIVALLVLLFRRPGGGEGAAGNFGKSKAAVISEGQIKLTFADVAGCDEAKSDLQEVVDFLRHPERYHLLGARIPHGVLL